MVVTDILDSAMLLYDQGELITVTVEGENSSLYRFEDELFILKYTRENVLTNIVRIDSEKAKEVFKDFSEEDKS